mgnify:FL=1
MQPFKCLLQLFNKNRKLVKLSKTLLTKMTNNNFINSEDEDIFYKLINSKDNKEKVRILENSWLNEKRESKDNIRIIIKGIEILNKGTDKEKIIALQVISRTSGFLLSDQLEEIFKISGAKISKGRETVSYNELKVIITKCLEFLTNQNGDLRFAAANTLHYLKSDLSKADHEETYKKILNLRKTINGKRRKTIEYCIEKFRPRDVSFMEDINNANYGKMVNNFDPETEKIWKENEIWAEKLGDAYYDSVLKESEELIKKDTKENVGYNMFVDGIKVGLDIIMPLLDEEMQEKAKDKIEQMLTKRAFTEQMGENLWNEGAYAKTLNTNDPNFQEKMKYFEEKPNEVKDFNCKNCNKPIGKHNLYWHENLCNDCFFDKHSM